MISRVHKIKQICVKLSLYLQYKCNICVLVFNRSIICHSFIYLLDKGLQTLQTISDRIKSMKKKHYKKSSIQRGIVFIAWLVLAAIAMCLLLSSLVDRYSGYSLHWLTTPISMIIGALLVMAFFFMLNENHLHSGMDANIHEIDTILLYHRFQTWIVYFYIFFSSNEINNNYYHKKFYYQKEKYRCSKTNNNRFCNHNNNKTSNNKSLTSFKRSRLFFLIHKVAIGVRTKQYSTNFRKHLKIQKDNIVTNYMTSVSNQLQQLFLLWTYLSS